METKIEPDPQFIKIHFHYGFANELNTFEQTLQKDLVMNGTISTSFWLTTEEQRLILSKVQSVNFFDFPDTIRQEVGSDSIMALTVPNPGIQFLRVQYKEQDKTVYWYAYLRDSQGNNDHATMLIQLTSLIIDIIESKPEYQSLPPAEGGYL
jgi:hypothetical protein